ncbi:MAG: class I SAM-dependent methyltransferase [bacterium]
MTVSPLPDVSHSHLDADRICTLYHRYAADLKRVRDYQRSLYARHVRLRRTRGVIFRLSGGLLDIGGMGATHRLHGKSGIVPMDPGLDDIEAEITYLLLREQRPARVIEIGASGGWSTSWILHALRDNGTGSLHSYDIVDYALGNLPTDLADGRWHFHVGDVRRADLTEPIDYLFIDCDHSREFAEWYLAELLPTLRPGTPISIHDIFHPDYVSRLWNATNNKMGEVSVIRRWLREREIEHFTPSRSWAPDTHRRLAECRRSIGLGADIHYGFANPMVFLRAL